MIHITMWYQRDWFQLEDYCAVEKFEFATIKAEESPRGVSFILLAERGGSHKAGQVFAERKW